MPAQKQPWCLPARVAGQWPSGAGCHKPCRRATENPMLGDLASARALQRMDECPRRWVACIWHLPSHHGRRRQFRYSLRRAEEVETREPATKPCARSLASMENCIIAADVVVSRGELQRIGTLPDPRGSVLTPPNLQTQGLFKRPPSACHRRPTTLLHDSCLSPD